MTIMGLGIKKNRTIFGGIVLLILFSLALVYFHFICGHHFSFPSDRLKDNGKNCPICAFAATICLFLHFLISDNFLEMLFGAIINFILISSLIQFSTKSVRAPPSMIFSR